MSHYTRQKHRFLADRTVYCGNQYSISCYGISWVFLCVMMLPSLTFKKYVKASLCTYPYIIELDAAMEASSLYVTMNCVTSSYTSLEDISPLTLYTVNIASTRYASHHRSSYVGLGAASRQEVIFSSEAYGKFRMTPSSM